MDNPQDAINVGKSQLISSKMLFEGGQYRDSVTMSYYAMYSSALALLLKKGISPKTHEGTLRQLAKEYVILQAEKFINEVETLLWFFLKKGKVIKYYLK